jgi:DNA-binding MarR family transcriptional regulator
MRPQLHREITLMMTRMRRLCSMAVNKRLAVVGSSMHVYMVLFRLVHEAEVPQHELAFDAAIDPAAASRLIRDMAADGLVTTRVDPADKRQRFVKLTPKGRILESTLQGIVDDALEPFMVGLTAEEEQQFLRLLRKAHEAVVAVVTDTDEPVRAPGRPRSVTALESAARDRAPRERSGTGRTKVTTASKRKHA